MKLILATILSTRCRNEHIISFLQKFIETNPLVIAVNPKKYSFNSKPFTPIRQNKELVPTNIVLQPVLLFIFPHIVTNLKIT